VAEDGETFFVNAVLEGENEVKLLEVWDCLMTREEYELWLDQLEQKSVARQRTRGAPD
jgi:hypothetical protein